jgi:hypothetical protein
VKGGLEAAFRERSATVVLTEILLRSLGLSYLKRKA